MRVRHVPCIGAQRASMHSPRRRPSARPPAGRRWARRCAALRAAFLTPTRTASDRRDERPAGDHARPLLTLAERDRSHRRDELRRLAERQWQKMRIAPCAEPPGSPPGGVPERQRRPAMGGSATRRCDPDAQAVTAARRDRSERSLHSLCSAASSDLIPSPPGSDQLRQPLAPAPTSEPVMHHGVQSRARASSTIQ